MNNELLEQIARQALGIETLGTRSSDDLDFHNLAALSVKDALEAAYRNGAQPTADMLQALKIAASDLDQVLNGETDEDDLLTAAVTLENLRATIEEAEVRMEERTQHHQGKCLLVFPRVLNEML